MRRLLIAIFLSLSLLSAAAPGARALDPETLRQDLTAALDRGLSAYRTGPLLYTGIETAAQGDAVRVKITDLTLPLPDRKGRIEFGDLAFTLADAPSGTSRDGRAGDRRYLVSEVIAASRAAVIDDTGENIALINYDLERLSGVWSTALRNFLDYDSAVANFEAVVPKAKLAIGIDRITTVQRSVSRGDGLIDLEVEGRITGQRFIVSQAGTVRIGEIFVEARAQGQDLAGVQALNEALDEAGNREAPPDRNRIAAILERLERVNMLPQGFIERIEVTDVSYLDAAQQPRFHLDELEFNLAGGDLQLALGYVSLGLRMAGIQATLPGHGNGDGATNPLHDLMPENLGVIASAERLPIQAAWRSVLRTLVLARAAGEQEPDIDILGDDMGAELQAAVNEAGTVLRLDRLDIEAPSGRLRAEGAFTVDPATAVGVRGRVDLTITGLDEMIAIATGPSGQAMPGIQRQMMFLYMLKGMARREAGPDGKPIDRLEIVLTPAGDVLFNGQPFSMAPPQ